MGSIDSGALLLAKKYLECISFTGRNIQFCFHLLLFAQASIVQSPSVLIVGRLPDDGA